MGPCSTHMSGIAGHAAALCVLLGVAVVCSTPVFGGQVKIDPRATYLHTVQDPALDAVPIALAAVGIQAGDVVSIVRLGDYDNGPAMTSTKG